jgi:hypothetical protein
MSRKVFRQSPPDYINDSDKRIRKGKEFNPERSVFDFIIYVTTQYAIKNNFAPPFRLHFADANQKLLKESILQIRKGELWEHITSEGVGQSKFPTSCRLTDRKGRQY